MSLNKCKRAAIYARVSTSHQVEERTISSQVQALTAYAIQRGFRLEEKHIYCDEGCSGSRLDRPALDRLRDDAYAGLLDVILILSPDRLARRYAYQVLLVEELERWGCEVIFLERPLKDNPEDRLLLEIQGAFAEYERALFMERARRGKLHKARAGQIMNVRAPYGYRYIHKRDGAPPSLVIDEAEAEVVRQIFQWYLEGKGVRWISRELSRRRIPTKFGRDRWPRSSIYLILENPAYLGTLFFNRTGYAEAGDEPGAETETGAGAERPALPGFPPHLHLHPHRRKRVLRPKGWVPIPAILDEETFEQAQQLRRKNQELAGRNSKRHEYLLRGLVRCGLCGRKMNGLTRKGYSYYRCRGKEVEEGMEGEGGERCPSRWVRASSLDGLVWEAVVGLLEEPRVVQEAFRRVQRAELAGDGPLRERIGRLEGLIQKSLGQIQRLIDAYTAGVIELRELRERREGLEARIDHLRGELAELREQERRRVEEWEVIQSLRAFRGALVRGLEGLTFEERRRLVRLLVEEVRA
jgi:site-specific DNA recombinase